MNAGDTHTTVAQLKQIMHDFVAARDWHQFHDAKNLSASIAIEAAELLEHFQWIHSDSIESIKHDPRQMDEIREEVADILAYVLSFASTMGIDLSSALADKIVKNNAKYPVDEFYGRFKSERPDASP